MTFVVKKYTLINIKYFINMTTDNQEITNTTTMFEALASICSDSIYVIDFKRKCFQYVNNHDLFLCGHSVEEVMQLGYNFYPRIVHPDDIPLLKEIFHEIFTVCSNTDQQDDIRYFSFTFRIRMYPQHRERPDYVIIYHKLVPVFIDNQLQSGICQVTCSETIITYDEADDEACKYSNKGSGNLRLYYKDNKNFDKYSLKSGKWKTHKIEHLTKNEKVILIWAMNGESNKSIAEKFCTSLDNLQHTLTRLYNKFSVKTMKQAIVHAINHSLIFNHCNDCDVPKQGHNKIANDKQYNKLTPETLCRIQDGLDSKQTVRFIAKQERVSEGAIRKAIKSKKLTKK
jgi:DNA-binding CsgD family transcriptional regulator